MIPEDTPRRVVRSASFVQKAAYDRAVARAEAAEAKLEAAEAKLAEIAARCKSPDALVGLMVAVDRDAILAITGTEEEAETS